ncbi:hypothetical protein [Streptomyces sp. NPDC006267]|uniref:hypothetical protein n=1 Tax=Streptomyces sp. NPDC006267 TaxID=3157173 RepID=UPI0033BE34BF
MNAPLRMKDQRDSRAGFALTAPQREVAQLLVAGKTPEQLPRNGRTAIDQTIARLQTNMGVLTLRAMCFRLLTLGLLPAPGRCAALDLDPVTRTAWEALRFDILDVNLAATVAAALSLGDDLRLSERAVDGALDRLTERFETTRHGLIRVGFAHGVLFDDQSVVPPAHAFAAPTSPGVGAWDASPAQRRVLALRASGRDVAACAVADGTTVDAVTGRLSACKRMADGVRTHRALIHRALCDGVLQRPVLQRDADHAEHKRAVWRHFALDEPDNALASRIGTHTGLGMSIVDRCMWDLRTRYRDDCAVVYEGWRHGILDADTPTDLACCTAPTPSAAGVL